MDATLDTVEVNDSELLRLIERDAPVEQLCTGFQFSEGPIWNPREQCLYFSDMPNDIRRRWSPRRRRRRGAESEQQVQRHDL